MIRFKEVTLLRDELKVLDNLSFTINTGELVLLVGGSGSGKSTILKLILALIKPTSGEIYIDNEKIRVAKFLETSDCECFFEVNE